MTEPITPLIPGVAHPRVGTDLSGRFVGRRPLPLPVIPRRRSSDICYAMAAVDGAMAAVDGSGRLGDRGLLEFLGWKPGHDGGRARGFGERVPRDGTRSRLAAHAVPCVPHQRRADLLG